LHLDDVRSLVFCNCRVITRVVDFQVLADVFSFLHQLGDFLEFLKGLTRVVKNKESEDLLQVLSEIIITGLVYSAL